MYCSDAPSLAQLTVGNVFAVGSQILPCIQETPLPAFHHRNDVFNDTCFVHFQAPAVAALPPSLWSNAAEPNYDSQDVELISAASVPRIDKAV